MTLSPPSRSFRPPRFTSGDADLTGESSSTSSVDVPTPFMAADLVSSVGDGTYVRSASSSAFQLTRAGFNFFTFSSPPPAFVRPGLLAPTGARGTPAKDRDTSAAALAAADAMSVSFGCGKPSRESPMSGRDRNGEAFVGEAVHKTRQHVSRIAHTMD